MAATMTDAVKMRMVIPFQSFERKSLPTKFGRRLIPVWPFSETNASTMRADAAPATPAGVLIFTVGLPPIARINSLRKGSPHWTGSASLKKAKENA
jgi:hypothetical protein